MARSIYDDFVDPGTHGQINIDDSTKKAIQSRIKNGPYDINLFDEAEQEIEMLLNMDIMTKFMKSDAFSLILKYVFNDLHQLIHLISRKVWISLCHPTKYNRCFANIRLNQLLNP